MTENFNVVCFKATDRAKQFEITEVFVKAARVQRDTHRD